MHHILHSIPLLILTVIVASCGIAPGRPAPTPTIAGGYSADPVLREFYFYLGGEKVLGRAIQPAVRNGAGRSQLFEKAMLIYDPTANKRNNFSLAPVGLDMGVEEPPVQANGQNQPRLSNGHVIAPDFVPMYERIGPMFAGKPISEAKYDSYRRRYVQYFENIGLYRLEGRNDVHLLDYGVWACNCQEELAWLLGRVPDNSIVNLYAQIDPVFQLFAKQLGQEFTGSPISEAYLNQEGRWEQIFQNMVLVARTPDNPASVQLRPMIREIRMPADMPRGSSNKEDVHFEEAGANLGYDIPNFFWDYITDHGGLEMFGAPVTHLAPLNGQVLHQCFENLCLIFDLNASPTRQVYPEPLGQSYKTLNYNKVRSSRTPSSGAVKLVLWQRYPVLAFNQVQEIGVSVLEEDQPAAGVVPTLLLTLPGNITKSATFPPTDANGRSILRMGPFEAANGDRILYKVCLPLPNGKQQCNGGSFVMWNNP